VIERAFKVVEGSSGSASTAAWDVRTPMLQLSRLSKTFGTGPSAVEALQDIGIDIGRGEFVTVVGPSGCGKSTLFNVLAGLAEPDPGAQILYSGEPRTAPELLGKVAFMPQRDLLLPWRRVVDNAILPLQVEGVSRAEALKRAAPMFGEFGLSGFERHYPQQLSGGMRQRVALMRTFLFERDLTLLDEPFGALDALTRSLMQRWLLEIWQRHQRTILFITHDVEEAIFLGDRVLVMTARPGRIKLVLDIPLSRPRPAEMLTSPEFIALKRQVLAAIEEESIKSFQQVAGG
jgi:ABC-type nitrate/sulfonate/bicarbonate transport system ATPase subunit